MALGLVPGAVTAVAFGAGGAALVSQVAGIGDAIATATVGAQGWLHDLVQLVAVLAVLGAAALIAIYTFTTVALLIGQPLFERLSIEVDTDVALEEGHDESWWRTTVRGLGEALRLALLTVPLAVGLFVIGLVPVVGGVVAFALGAVAGGWFLTLELTSFPLARRGVVRLSDRRRVLREHRPTAIGFGACVFVLFLIPLGALAFMPAAVAGATLLVRDLSDRERPAPLPPPAPPG